MFNRTDIVDAQLPGVVVSDIVPLPSNGLRADFAIDSDIKALKNAEQYKNYVVLLIPNYSTRNNKNEVVLYYNVGFEEPVYEHSRYVLNTWFYSPDYDGYFDAEFPFKFFLFPINDSSNLQNTYSAKFKLNKTFITLSIRDMVYANELPQNYKEDFTLTAVIELK